VLSEPAIAFLALSVLPNTVLNWRAITETTCSEWPAHQPVRQNRNHENGFLPSTASNRKVVRNRAGGRRGRRGRLSRRVAGDGRWGRSSLTLFVASVFEQRTVDCGFPAAAWFAGLTVRAAAGLRLVLRLEKQTFQCFEHSISQCWANGFHPAVGYCKSICFSRSPGRFNLFLDQLAGCADYNPQTRLQPLTDIAIFMPGKPRAHGGRIVAISTGGLRIPQIMRLPTRLVFTHLVWRPSGKKQWKGAVLLRKTKVSQRGP